MSFPVIVVVAEVDRIRVEFFAFHVATYSRYYVSVYFTYHSGFIILTYTHDHHINYADFIAEYRKIAGHSKL